MIDVQRVQGNRVPWSAFPDLLARTNDSEIPGHKRYTVVLGGVLASGRRVYDCDYTFLPTPTRPRDTWDGTSPAAGARPSRAAPATSASSGRSAVVASLKMN